MMLSAGATGFGSVRARLTSVDVGAFITLCFAAARSTGGTVRDVKRAGVTPSFHSVVIDYPTHQIAVLCHCCLPLLALATPPREGDAGTPVFAECVRLAQVLGESPDFQIMTAPQLNTPLQHVNLSQLDDAEHEMIRYWQPATVGDLLFNYWD